MTEYEKTYLVKRIPPGLQDCESDEIVDLYMPDSAKHPDLRLRSYQDKFELTRKRPVSGSASVQKEETITLDRDEYAVFAKVPGKILRKRRYRYPVGDLTAEIDAYGGELHGLVYVEFEFPNEQALKSFKPPGWCGADISEADWAAAGMLAGKSYADIEVHLRKHGYEKVAA